MRALADKVCVITGGAGSIGRATAALFVAEGARVLLVDRDADALAAAAAELPDKQARAVRADVTQPDEVERAIAQAVAAWGGIDVLFANAGTSGTNAPIERYPLEDFRAVLDVHVAGAFLTCKYGVPHLNDGASVIITSSIMGVRASAGSYGYVAAKHAQVGLMRALAKQLAPRGIRVNTIHPGPVDNEFQLAIERRMSAVLDRDATAFLNGQIPLGRHAQAHEIARSVLYLASDQSSFTTGTTLLVDGGLSG